jgi:hypothetical protein
VYCYDEYIFVGANVGPLTTVRNPYNTGKHEALPAPYDLDHTKVTTDVKDRRQYLSFLGVAHRNDTALLAPAKFSGHKPYSSMVGLAQAQVFNNHSFDLWTPMWSAQVEMISDYPGWVDTLESGISDASAIPDGTLGDADLTSLAKYLRANEDLAKISLTH